jgi:hypothetical protein
MQPLHRSARLRSYTPHSLYTTHWHSLWHASNLQHVHSLSQFPVRRQLVQCPSKSSKWIGCIIHKKQQPHREAQLRLQRGVVVTVYLHQWLGVVKAWPSN